MKMSTVWFRETWLLRIPFFFCFCFFLTQTQSVIMDLHLQTYLRQGRLTFIKLIFHVCCSKKHLSLWWHVVSHCSKLKKTTWAKTTSAWFWKVLESHCFVESENHRVTEFSNFLLLLWFYSQTFKMELTHGCSCSGGPVSISPAAPVGRPAQPTVTPRLQSRTLFQTRASHQSNLGLCRPIWTTSKYVQYDLEIHLHKCVSFKCADTN